LLREIDDASDLLDPEDAAVVDVGELRDTEAFEGLRQIVDEDVGFRDPVVVRLDQPRVSRSR